MALEGKSIDTTLLQSPGRALELYFVDNKSIVNLVLAVLTVHNALYIVVRSDGSLDSNEE